MRKKAFSVLSEGLISVTRSMIYQSNQFFSSTGFKGGFYQYPVLTTLRPPLGPDYFSTHYSYMYQFPVFSFLRYPKFMAMVWGKSWQKLKENAKFWFFTIFRHQYDYFQIKNLCKCPSLVLCDEIEYWGYSWLISLSTGNTLRILLLSTRSYIQYSNRPYCV